MHKTQQFITGTWKQQINLLFGLKGQSREKSFSNNCRVHGVALGFKEG
jgi:hypothetical protein